MLSRLFGTRRRHQEGAAPEVPSGSRIYAIGDVHGRAELLRHLHHLVHEDAYRHQAPRNVVVYLGDYIDRGDESRGVIDLLLGEPLPGFEHVHLKGNHEASLLQFLDDLAIGPSWMLYGGAATLYSYGVRPPEPMTDTGELMRAQRELAARLPDAHRAFLGALPLVHVEGDYLFVHAGIRPGVPLDRQTPEDLMWIREEFLESDADYGKIVVHGHTITEEPEVRRNRIGIDTGAFASGRLTCLALAGTDWSFLQT
jgi:serine/threonine protein phosphatase 1